MKSKLFYLCLGCLGILYFLLRFLNFTPNFVFRPDQGLHLLESFDMVATGHPRLLGPLVSSKNFDNRNFFIGGHYYYALALLGSVTGWNPLSMTLLYDILEFIFVIFFIFWLRHKFGPFPALTVFAFIALFPYLISHGRFYWNPHFLLPLSIIEVFLLDRFYHARRRLNLFLAAVIWGCAFAFHYAAILWVIFFIYLIFRRVISLKLLPLLAVGFVLGDLPFFISEVRHNFYNFRTIYFVYTHAADSGLLYSHYFIYPFLIFGLFVVSYFLHQYAAHKILSGLLVAALCLLAYFFPVPDELDAIPGWYYPQQLRTVDFILSAGCPPNYNIATTISGDTRSYDLRSLLTVRSCPPLPVEQYPQASTIFLIAPPTRPPDTETVWEISSFRPFKIELTQVLNDQVILYRLSKP